MYSNDRYQEGRKFSPLALLSSGDLKSAANTVLGYYGIPLTYGSLAVKALGFNYQAAGGAQTTAGILGILINGVEPLDANGNPFRVSSAVNHGQLGSVEVSTNQTVSPLNAPGPVFPVLNPGDIVSFFVVTQAVGAGDQTIYPYIIGSLATLS